MLFWLGALDKLCCFGLSYSSSNNDDGSDEKDKLFIYITRNYFTFGGTRKYLTDLP